MTFKDSLQTKDFVVTAHVNLAEAPDAESLIQQGEILRPAVDAVQLTDGIAVEHLRKKHGLRRIAYVDIDAHHGDGVFYGFEDDPDLIFADLHEDGRYLCYRNSWLLERHGYRTPAQVLKQALEVAA